MAWSGRDFAAATRLSNSSLASHRQTCFILSSSAHLGLVSLNYALNVLDLVRWIQPEISESHHLVLDFINCSNWLASCASLNLLAFSDNTKLR